MLAVDVLVITNTPHDDDATITGVILFAFAAFQTLACRIGEHACHLADQCRINIVIFTPHAILHLLWAVVFQYAFCVFLPAGNVRLEEIPVDDIFMIFQQHMRNGIQEADITIKNRYMDGVLRIDVLVTHYCTGTSWIDDHRWNIGFLFVISRTPENDRMCFTGVMTEMHDHVSELYIFISQWRRIGAQGSEITGHCRSHAHAGIGFDSI